MATYQLALEPNILRHDLIREVLPLFGDYDDQDIVDTRKFNVFDAMAASGDWFVTVATRLDKLAQGLPQDSAEQIELEHLVTMMFYLQDHYNVTYKSKK